MPHARIAIISSEVATGRKMKMRDGFMCGHRLWRCQPHVQECLQRGSSAGGSLWAVRVRAGRPSAATEETAFAIPLAAGEVAVVFRVLRRRGVDRSVRRELDGCAI